MISKDINKIDDIIPHILKLGFVKKSTSNYSDRIVKKYVTFTKIEYIQIVTTKYTEKSDTPNTEGISIHFMYEDIDRKSIWKKGFPDVIETLNNNFVHIFRKEKINKLLDI